MNIMTQEGVYIVPPGEDEEEQEEEDPEPDKVIRYEKLELLEIITKEY